MKRLLATFKVEAAEHIERISSGLLELEKTRAADRRAELTEIVFREAHSLKGAARTVNNATVETVCRSMENIFSVLKKQDAALASDLFDLLHKALDLLRDLLGALDAEGRAPDKSLVKGVVSDLDKAAAGLEAKAPDSRPTDRPGAGRDAGPAAGPQHSYASRSRERPGGKGEARRPPAPGGRIAPGETVHRGEGLRAAGDARGF